MKTLFHSNGKLLITAEYYVLAGAKALAVPSQYGQSLQYKREDQNCLLWKSFDQQGEIWYEGKFELENLLEKGVQKTKIGTKLTQILQATRALNPTFLSHGGQVDTHLEFDRHWGLGSSSTLISNIAQWAQVNPFSLLDMTFGGSGYDISCASAKSAIHYTKNKLTPEVVPVPFNPPFASNLFFVYQNSKQNSQAEIERTKSVPFHDIERMNQLTETITLCNNQTEFNQLLLEHETLVSRYLNREPLQKSQFRDFGGQIKSLGAWGGDFMLVSGNPESPSYFKSKGYTTIFKFTEILKN